MNIDLESMSGAELKKLRADVDKAIAGLADREKRKALEAAERVVAEHGFSLADLTGLVGAKKGKTKGPAKFRNPADPSQTWSGRGRKPKWILDGEAAGRPMSDFAI